MLLLLAHLACRIDPKDTANLPGDTADAAPDTGADSSTESGGDSSGDTSEDTETGHTGHTGVTECVDVPAPALSTTSWSRAGNAPASNFSTIVQGEDGDPIFVASMLTGMWRSDNGGSAWDVLRTPTTHILSDLSLDPDDPRTVYFSSGGIAFRTTDGGESFEQLPLGSITSGMVVEVFSIEVAPYDANRILAATTGGDVYLSTDRGGSFNLVSSLHLLADDRPSPSAMDLYWRILPNVSADGSAVFTDGRSLSVSTDASLTSWVPSFTAPVATRSLLRDPVRPDHLLIGAPDGLYGSEDGGFSFERVNTEVTPEVGAWSRDGSHVAFASMDTLWISTDGGETYTTGALPFMAMPAIGFFDNHLFLAWNDGMKVSMDDGATWEEASGGLMDGGLSVIAPDPSCPGRLMTGSRCSGGVYHSSDYGTVFSHEPFFFHYVMGIFYDPSDATRVWAVSDENLARSDDGGNSWRTVRSQYHFHGFAVDPDDGETVLLGSVGSGSYQDTQANVYRSRDGGETWETTSTGIPASESSAHALLHWPGNADVVLLGTYKAGDESHSTGQGIGLYRSTDRGDTWSLTSLPRLDIAWLVATPDGVAAATEDGLWHSTDEGVTWEPYDGPTGAILSATFQGDLGLALAGTTEVYRTDDGGATWYTWSDGLSVRGDVDSWLAAIAIDAGGEVAWLTDYPNGTFRIGL